MENISEEELAIKKMGLNPWQDGVIKLSVFNTEKRKQLLDTWKLKHPETKKTWRTHSTQGDEMIRCQSQVVVKKISATIEIQRTEPDLPAPLNRTDSIRSDISDIDVSILPADAQQYQEDVQNMRNETADELLLDPTLQIIKMSEIYIDDDNLSKWAKEHLTAHEFEIEPAPVKALSENNRYEIKRYYEYIPEEVFRSKKH